MTPTVPVTIADAISAYEQNDQNRAAIVAKRATDQTAADAAQAKADAAKAVVSQDAKDESTAVQAELDSLSALKTAIDAKVAELTPVA